MKTRPTARTYMIAGASVLALASALTAASAQGAAARGGGRQTTAGVISTLGGGPGGPEDATNVALKPCSVTFTEDGHLYVSDPGPKTGAINTTPVRHRDHADSSLKPVSSGAVWEMSAGSSLLTPFAGTYALPGPAGDIGDGGPATGATMSTCGVAEDHSRNLVIADRLTCRIRVVAASTGTFYGQAMTTGDTYTIAGDGACRFSGDGGKALQAGLDPIAVQVDTAGNLVIPDLHNRIRVVAEHSGTFYGVPMTAGHIYTIAGTGTAGFSGDGGPAIDATLSRPAGLALDSAGNLVISDTGNCRIRVVAETTGTYYGQAMTAGDIYTVAGDGICGFTGNGGSATSAELDPGQTAVATAGNLVVPDSTSERVRVVAETNGLFYGQTMKAGHIYTIAGNGTAGFSGDGGPATSAELNGPSAAGVDSAGNVAIADTLNDRVRVVAGTTGTYYGQAMTAGHIYTIAGNGNLAFSGDGGPLAAAEFHDPGNLAVGPDGSLVAVDYADNRIRLVPAATGTFFGQAMTAGDIYTIAGNGVDGGDSTAHGVPAIDVPLNDPAGQAVDAAGNLVVSDTEDCMLKVVADHAGTFYGQAMKAGDIYTAAGEGYKPGCVFSGNGSPATGTRLHPAGVAVDAAGNLVIVDTWNCRVLVVADRTGTFYRQAMTAGHIYSIAGDGTCGFSGDGGPAASAQLDPGQLGAGQLQDSSQPAIDAAGNLIIPDSSNDRVRVVAAATGLFYGQAMKAGHIYTIAGNGTAGFSGDGGPATSAELNHPREVAIDSAGNVAISDYLNDRVRVVAATTGTFYGIPMTAGSIYTIAGNGTAGFSGDGGPSANSELSAPMGLAVDHSGDLLIADGDGNNRIRAVTGQG